MQWRIITCRVSLLWMSDWKPSCHWCITTYGASCMLWIYDVLAGSISTNVLISNDLWWSKFVVTTYHALRLVPRYGYQIAIFHAMAAGYLHFFVFEWYSMVNQCLTTYGSDYILWTLACNLSCISVLLSMGLATCCILWVPTWLVCTHALQKLVRCTKTWLQFIIH